MPRGSFATQRLTEYFDESRDSFDKDVADAVQNQLDIASQYNFSPERLRLFKNDTRQFVQYDTISEFTDRPNTWRVDPAQGDSWHLESAESTTYVVNYDIRTSFAVQLSRELESGDVLKLGPRGSDDADGFFIEQRGSDHGPKEVDLIQLKGGTETTLKSNVKIPRAFTTATRIGVDYSSYAVGKQTWTQTYTDDGIQNNEEFAQTSVDDEFSTEEFNLNLLQEFERGSSASAISVDFGSMGAIKMGDPTALTRSKPQLVEVTLPNTNNTWLPVYAIRIDPNNDSVNARINIINILSYGNNAVLELVAASMSPQKTNIADGDWKVPDYHHAQNSALQDQKAENTKTANVYEVPDDTGTQKELTSSDKFGGFTLASAAINSGGNTAKDTATIGEASLSKKNVQASDHLVFLARTPNAGATLRFVWQIDQNW